MYAIANRLWNSQRAITSLTPWISVADHKYTGFLFEEFPNLVRTEIPQSRNLSHGIVTFGVSCVLDLN
jgi:hypothetical protein